MQPLLPETLLFRQDFRRESSTQRAAFCLSRCPCEIVGSAQADFLSPDEAAHVGGLSIARRRDSHLLGRYCAKEAIACLVDQPTLRSLEIRSGVFQQPVVRGAPVEGIQVSLSHSGGWGAAVAFDDTHPMGIDLEVVNADRCAAIASQLTPKEAQMLRSLPISTDEVLALAWTVKEALSKTLRTGMMTPFTLFETTEPQWDQDVLTCHFTHFGQYRAVGFLDSGFALGIVLPRHSTPTCPLPEFRARFQSPS